MICKKCNQEMPEVGAFCPFCGEPKEIQEQEILTEEVLTEEIPAEEISAEEVPAEEEIPVEEAGETAPEEAPKKKMKLWQLIAIIAGGVVLLGVLVCAVLYGLGVVDFKPASNDIFAKSVYTVDDETAIAKKDKVVATLGDKELTNGELQLYYQNMIYTFYSQYSYYMSYMGLDLSKPLSEQPCGMEEGKSWEQYFLEGALRNWQSYTLMEMEVERTGFEIDPALREELDGMTTQMEDYAAQMGYESLEAYMADGIGSNVTLDKYVHFNEVYYVTNEYLGTFYEATPTDAEIEAYYTANEATFTENGVTRDLGLQSSVRHILVSPQGGTTNEETGETTYTQEEWDAALAEAEAILQQWKEGEATEESFAELVANNTDDSGSAATGGLCEAVNVDANYVQAFRDWATDDSRVPGDTGIVETEFGYHIMYFVEGEDYWTVLVSGELVAEQIKTMMDEAREASPFKVRYKQICLAETEFM